MRGRDRVFFSPFVARRPAAERFCAHACDAAPGDSGSTTMAMNGSGTCAPPIVENVIRLELAAETHSELLDF
jgi:hypothetical protein